MVQSSTVEELRNLLGETNGYLDAKLTHFPLVETDHFYRQDLVSHLEFSC